MALPPCHLLFQVVVEGTHIKSALYQRSGDMFLGVPFNVASYAILTHMIALLTGYTAVEFTHFIADAHVYNTHFDAVRTQLGRDPKTYPTLSFGAHVMSIANCRF